MAFTKQIPNVYYVIKLTNIQPSKKCFEVFHTTVNNSAEETNNNNKLPDLNVTSCFRFKFCICYRQICIINFLKMPNASLVRLLLAYKSMRCSNTRARHQQRSHTLPSFSAPKPHAFSIAKLLKFFRLYTYWSSSFAFRMKEPTAVVASVKRASHWYYACKSEINVVK